MNSQLVAIPRVKPLGNPTFLESMVEGFSALTCGLFDRGQGSSPSYLEPEKINRLLYDELLKIFNHLSSSSEQRKNFVNGYKDIVDSGNLRIMAINPTFSRVIPFLFQIVNCSTPLNGEIRTKDLQYDEGYITGLDLKILMGSEDVTVHIGKDVGSEKRSPSSLNALFDKASQHRSKDGIKLDDLCQTRRLQVNPRDLGSVCALITDFISDYRNQQLGVSNLSLLFPLSENKFEVSKIDISVIKAVSIPNYILVNKTDFENFMSSVESAYSTASQLKNINNELVNNRFREFKAAVACLQDQAQFDCRDYFQGYKNGSDGFAEEVKRFLEQVVEDLKTFTKQKFSIVLFEKAHHALAEGVRCFNLE